MTTIAYKDGVLAVDKQATDGLVKYKCRKVIVQGGHAFAIAGCLGVGMATVAWITEGTESECPLMANEDESATVIQLETATGRCWAWEYPGVPIEVKDRISAWGSGAQVAIGAMAAGATPPEAVKIAAEWTIGTGFGVETYGVPRKKPARRAKPSV